MTGESDAGEASAMSVDTQYDPPHDRDEMNGGDGTETPGEANGDRSTARGGPSSSGNDEPPSFDAPPSSIVSKDGLQTSLLGRSARHQKYDQDSTGTGSARRSRSRELSPKRAYAVQHQESEDKKQQQDQSIENIDDNETAVRQKQSQERGDGEMAEQENDVTIRQESDNEGHDRLAVETSQHNKGGSSSKDGPVKQVNYVKVIKKGDDCASCTSSGGTLRRPTLQKHLLRIVEFGDDLGEAVRTPSRENEDEYERHLSAPSVFLSIEDKNYVLFRRWSGDLEDGFSLEEELYFEDTGKHELYYEQIESFFEALHAEFDSLNDKSSELVLRLPELGLDLHEDSVYTREVALYDLDRIHVGCGLPGRLRVVVTSEPRFSTNFNLLTHHIAKSYDSGKIESTHAVSPASFREIVDEGSPKPDRRQRNENERDQNGEAENHDGDDDQPLLNDDGDGNGDDDDDDVGEIDYGDEADQSIDQVIDQVEAEASLDDADQDMTGDGDDLEAPLDDLQVPDVDPEAERVEGAAQSVGGAMPSEGKVEVELAGVAGAEEDEEDYAATQAVDDETAHGQGTEYADVVEEGLEGEHAEDNLVEAAPEAPADDVPGDEGRPPALVQPSDSATRPVASADLAAEETFDYSAQDDQVEAVIDAGPSLDPGDDVEIDYSADADAPALEATPASPSSAKASNVRDSSAAELDTPSAAAKRRRTASDGQAAEDDAAQS